MNGRADGELFGTYLDFTIEQLDKMLHLFPVTQQVDDVEQVNRMLCGDEYENRLRLWEKHRTQCEYHTMNKQVNKRTQENKRLKTMIKNKKVQWMSDLHRVNNKSSKGYVLEVYMDELERFITKEHDTSSFNLNKRDYLKSVDRVMEKFIRLFIGGSGDLHEFLIKIALQNVQILIRGVPMKWLDDAVKYNENLQFINDFNKLKVPMINVGVIDIRCKFCGEDITFLPTSEVLFTGNDQCCLDHWIRPMESFFDDRALTHTGKSIMPMLQNIDGGKMAECREKYIEVARRFPPHILTENDFIRSVGGCSSDMLVVIPRIRFSNGISILALRNKV